MAKFKPWLKMWVEWIDDLKMLRLSLAEQGAWWRLCTLAQKCVAEGAIVHEDGEPMTMVDIYDALRIKAEDYEIFNSMLAKMQKAQSVHWDGNTMVVTNFLIRQTKSASDTAEAIKERVRRYRQKAAGGDIPEIAQEIRDRLRALPRYESYLVEHEAMKAELTELAKSKGYKPKTEVTTPDGRVDLCWCDKNGNYTFGFEIDANLPKYKSLVKLRSLGIDSMVILRRNTTPYQWEQDILLIGLGRPKFKDEIDTPTLPKNKEEELEGEAEEEAECNAHVTALHSRYKHECDQKNVTENSLQDLEKGLGNGNSVTEEDLEIELGNGKLVTKAGLVYKPEGLKIIDLFHSLCPSLPRVRELTERRRKSLGTIYKKVPDPAELLTELFTKTEASDFLSNRIPRSSEHSNWKCNFDWLLEDKNRVKVLEGNYDNDNPGEKDGERFSDTGRDPLKESKDRGLQVTED